MPYFVPADYRAKVKESERKDKYLDLSPHPTPPQKTKTDVEHESNGDTYCNWSAWNGPQRLRKALEELEIAGRIETIETAVLSRPEYSKES